MPKKNPLDRLGLAGTRIHVEALPETRQQVDDDLCRFHYRFQLKYRHRRVTATHLIGALLTWYTEAIDEDSRDRLLLRYSQLYDRRREKQPGAADYPTQAEAHPMAPPVRP